MELPEEEATLVGNTLQLSPLVTPWNAVDQSVTWASSNEEVAAVDGTGLVTGISAGTAIITATSVADPTKSASCAVTIGTLDTELKALVWDDDGMVWWSAFNTNTIPSFEKLSATSLPVNATMVADGVLFASTLEGSGGYSNLYTVDPKTFKMTEAGSSYTAYVDMAYGPGCGYGFAVDHDMIVVIDPETGEYAGGWPWTEGLASDLVGITYYGSEYNEEFGGMMDFFLLLDADGNVYLEACLITNEASGYFYGPYDGYLQNIGAPVDRSSHQGFYYDGTYTYWARYGRDDEQAELLAWDTDGTGRVYTLGSFPAGVGSVCGLYSDTEFEGGKALISDEMFPESLKSAPMPTSFEVTEQRTDRTVTVAVTMLEDATNGIFTVSYDGEKLECLEVTSPADASVHIIDSGSTAVAFAAKSPVPAGEPVACLTFGILSEGSHRITITTAELNEGACDHTETITIDLGHSCPSEHFVDVSKDQWFHEAVDYVVSSGYMKGMDGTHFGPGATMNRAQFVTVLYRMEGEPQVTNTGIFTDIPDGQFYTNAVYWALESKITTGTGDGTTFTPGGHLTRTELVTFMYRYAKYKNYDTATGDLSAFRDAGQVPPFAVDAWSWAVSKQIVSGMTADTLVPMAQTNRAQAAAIFQRFDRAFLMER